MMYTDTKKKKINNKGPMIRCWVVYLRLMRKRPKTLELLVNPFLACNKIMAYMYLRHFFITALTEFVLYKITW